MKCFCANKELFRIFATAFERMVSNLMKTELRIENTEKQIEKLPRKKIAPDLCTFAVGKTEYYAC